MKRIAVILICIVLVVGGVLLIAHLQRSPRPAPPQRMASSAPTSLPAGLRIVRVKLPAGSLPIAGPSGPGVEIKTVRRKGNWNDVFVKKDGRWVNLTRFERPQHIIDAAAAPDGRFVYVWHHEYPPRKLAIYDVASTRLVRRFVPGFGGSLRWTPADTIFHHWGAGTNTGCYVMYDVHGREIWSGDTSGLSLSPSARFLATFPTVFVAGEPLVLTDLASCAAIYTSKGKADIRMVNDPKWIGDGELHLGYLDSGQKHHRMKLLIGEAARR